MQIAAQFREGLDRYIDMPFNLTGDLPEVHFRYKEPPGVFEFCQCMLSKWPYCPEPQEPDIFVRMIVHQLLDGTDRCTVCDENLFGIRVNNIIICNRIAGRFNLFDKPHDKGLVQLRVRGTRVSPFIVGEAGHMDTVAFAKTGGSRG